MHKRIHISLKIVLLLILIFSKLNTFAWTANVTVDGIKYEIYITGQKSDAVADSAYVGINCEIHDYTFNPYYIYYQGETANIASSVTYIYTWNELVGYDNYNHPIYENRTKYLTAPVIGIKDSYTAGMSEYYAFGKSSKLKSVYIPNTVKYIGRNAFTLCKELTHIDIPSSVTTIGNGAFHSTGLTGELTIPNSVTFIDKGAFSYTQISTIHLSNSITDINESTFQGTLLTDVNIPNSVKQIGSCAFGWCNRLKSVTIPSSVENIIDGAFYSCDSLVRVNICDLASWCNINFSLGGNPLRIAHHLYLNDEEITDLIIPSTVNRIGTYCFTGCNSIKQVSIPNSVNTIGAGAFSDCGITEITIPISVTTIGNYAFAGCSYLTEISIPNSVTTVGRYAFQYCRGLKSMEIPKSVKVIGQNAFFHDRSLSTVFWNADSCTLDMSESVQAYPFSLSVSESDPYSTERFHLIIGENVKSIGDNIFKSTRQGTDWQGVPYHNYWVTRIDTIICHAKVPPLITAECFNESSYNYVVLSVPEESLQLYCDAEGWKKFKRIETFNNHTIVLGDANGDGEVNVADVNAVINIILDGEFSSAYDVNDDGEINIADINDIISIILNR